MFEERYNAAMGGLKISEDFQQRTLDFLREQGADGEAVGVAAEAEAGQGSPAGLGVNRESRRWSAAKWRRYGLAAACIVVALVAIPLFREGLPLPFDAAVSEEAAPEAMSGEEIVEEEGVYPAEDADGEEMASDDLSVNSAANTFGVLSDQTTAEADAAEKEAMDSGADVDAFSSYVVSGDSGAAAGGAGAPEAVREEPAPMPDAPAAPTAAKGELAETEMAAANLPINIYYVPQEGGREDQAAARSGVASTAIELPANPNAVFAAWKEANGIEADAGILSFRIEDNGYETVTDGMAEYKVGNRFTGLLDLSGEFLPVTQTDRWPLLKQSLSQTFCEYLDLDELKITVAGQSV